MINFSLTSNQTQFVNQLKLWGMKPGDPLVVLHDIKKPHELPYKMAPVEHELKWNFKSSRVSLRRRLQHDNWGGICQGV